MLRRTAPAAARMKHRVHWIGFSHWLLHNEWLVLAVLAVPMLFPSPAAAPLMLIIPGLWALRRWRDGAFIPATSLNLQLLLLTLMLLVSLWATFSIAFSLPKISGLVFGFAVYFATVQVCVQRPNGLGLALTAFMLFGTAVAFVGLIGTDWADKTHLLARVGSMLPRLIRGLPGAEHGIHPNELAGTLVLFSPLTVLVSAAGFRRKGIAGLLAGAGWTLAAAIMLTVLLLTQSRTGILGLVGGSTLALLAFGGWKSRLLILGGIGVIVGAIERLLPDLASSILNTPGLGQDLVGGVAFETRFEIWIRAIYAIQDFSFTGMGLGTFREVAPILYPFFLIPPDRDVAHAHSALLQAGLDVGIPGLIAYLAIWLGAFALLLALRNKQEPRALAFGLSPGALAFGLAGGLAAHFLFGLVDAVALGARPGFLWWMALGLVSGLHRLSR
ncbi:MAG: O-antigen ligase family protein [Anaerolineales bacterium]